MSGQNKKWRILLLLIVIIITGVLLIGCKASEKKEAKVEKVDFHLNHFMSAMHPVHVNILEPFAKDVKEKTEGRVEIFIHPGNALASPGDTYDAVVSGVAGMGFVLPAYTPGRFPLSQILEYPFLFSSALQANLTAKDMIPMLREYEYTDTMLLWFGGSDLGHLLLKADARNLAGLRGKRLRSPGPIYNDVIAAIGGVAVTLPVSDLYDSMDRGIVDGSFMAPSALISFRLMEVTNHIVELNLYTTPFIFFANKQLWDKVSPADQKIMLDLLDAFPEKIGRQYDAEIDHAMALARERNKDIKTLSAADLASFHQAVDPLVQKWIGELEAAGKPGQRMYNLVLESAKKYAK